MPKELKRLAHHVRQIQIMADMEGSPDQVVRQYIGNGHFRYGNQDLSEYLRDEISREAIYRVLASDVQAVRSGAVLVAMPDGVGKGDEICRACPASHRYSNEPGRCPSRNIVEARDTDMLRQAYFSAVGNRRNLL